MQTIGQHIPISAIHASLTNPRKRFNEADLSELADSIKQHGVMQPILVRPVNMDEIKSGASNIFEYEIVAGERRYRASKLAGVDTIPCVVKVLDDLETLQLQIIENLQRSDLHPLEEAQGFKALLDNKDAKSWDADQLAAKIGKSRSYIYGALKLNELCTYAKDQFLEDKYGREIALLIARIPGAKLQEQAAKEIIGREFSYRAAKQYVRNTFTLDLSKAPWDKISITLYPPAGSCLSCTKRTGNYPELYPDIESADVCTDTACFAAKKVAYAKDVIASNPRTIHGEEADKINPFSNTNYLREGFTTNLREVNYEGYSASDFLDESTIEPYVLVDDKNNTTNVFKIEEVKTVLAEKIEAKIASGELELPVKKEVKDPQWLIDQRERDANRKAERDRRLHIFNRIVPHISKDFCEVLTATINFIYKNFDINLEHIKTHYQFYGTDEEFFIEFIPTVDECIKLLGMMTFSASLDTYSDGSAEDNAEDEDYQRLLTFIGNIGLDVSQFLTAELPLTPPLAALANENTPEQTASEPETKLPSKLHVIKDKELAKRAKKAQRQEQKESAEADPNTSALTESAQTSEASQPEEVEA